MSSSDSHGRSRAETYFLRFDSIDRSRLQHSEPRKRSHKLLRSLSKHSAELEREKKLLPSRSWDAYEALLRAVGEHRAEDNENDIAFLAAVGLIKEAPKPATRTGRPALTSDGSRYFTERFIRRDAEAATRILKVQLAGYPPAAAVVQFLAGVKDADRSTAETVLRSQGFGGDLTDRNWVRC